MTRDDEELVPRATASGLGLDHQHWRAFRDTGTHNRRRESISNRVLHTVKYRAKEWGNP